MTTFLISQSIRKKIHPPLIDRLNMKNFLIILLTIYYALKIKFFKCAKKIKIKNKKIPKMMKILKRKIFSLLNFSDRSERSFPDDWIFRKLTFLFSFLIFTHNLDANPRKHVLHTNAFTNWSCFIVFKQFFFLSFDSFLLCGWRFNKVFVDADFIAWHVIFYSSNATLFMFLLHMCYSILISFVFKDIKYHDSCYFNRIAVMQLLLLN